MVLISPILERDNNHGEVLWNTAGMYNSLQAHYIAIDERDQGRFLRVQVRSPLREKLSLKF